MINRVLQLAYGSSEPCHCPAGAEHEPVLLTRVSFVVLDVVLQYLVYHKDDLARQAARGAREACRDGVTRWDADFLHSLKRVILFHVILVGDLCPAAGRRRIRMQPRPSRACRKRRLKRGKGFFASLSKQRTGLQ